MGPEGAALFMPCSVYIPYIYNKLYQTREALKLLSQRASASMAKLYEQAYGGCYCLIEKSLHKHHNTPALLCKVQCFCMPLLPRSQLHTDPTPVLLNQSLLAVGFPIQNAVQCEAMQGNSAYVRPLSYSKATGLTEMWPNINILK